MKRTLALVGAVAVFTVGAIALPASTEDTGKRVAETVPNPVTCEGYPEPRVYLENQTWWTPQNGPDSHPGHDKQGHVHVETCFPAYQTFDNSDTIGFDLTVRLHNMPGELMDIQIATYGDLPTVLLDKPVVRRRCPTVDCAYTFHANLSLANAQYSGILSPMIRVRYSNEPGSDGTRHNQLTLPRWPIIMDNGKPLPPPNSTAGATAAGIEARGLVGDTLYPNVIGNDYAQVAIAKADLPFDAETLEPKTISGTWRPKVFFEEDAGFAYVDAALHAVPMTKGTVIYEGAGRPGVRADSTALRLTRRSSQTAFTSCLSVRAMRTRP